MDAQSEILFLRQLNEALGTRTVIMVTHRPAVLELAQRVVVVDGGKVILDGPKAQVLAALSGAKPAASATPEANASPNVHLHPSTQPVQRGASV
jgi:ATP-binding cassette subfamily C protein LapB